MGHKQKWHVSFLGGGFEELACPSSFLFSWHDNLGNHMLIFSGIGEKELACLCNWTKKNPHQLASDFV